MSNPTATSPSTNATAAVGDNRPATLSLILGLLAVPSAFAFGVGAILGVAAIVCGVRGIRLAREGAGRRPFAIVGIISGAVGILMVVGYLLDQAGV